MCFPILILCLRYNPFVAWMFMGTETALKINGKPTIRFHMYTVVHNPAVSTTKALEFEVKLAAASKFGNTPLIKHIAAHSSMKVEHEKMLDNSIVKLVNPEHIFATNAVVTVKLLGGAAKTFEFSKTFALGLKDMTLKWNFHLVEKNTTPRTFCMLGALELPTETQAIRKFKFQNKIGFGATCEQHEITMNGVTVTSQRQIEFSRRSEAAKECPRIAREASELDMHIRTLPEGAERAKMVSTYGQMVLKRESMCGLKKMQETALDQVNFSKLNWFWNLFVRLRSRSLPPPTSLLKCTLLEDTWTPSSRVCSSNTSTSCPTSASGICMVSRWSSSSTRGWKRST